MRARDRERIPLPVLDGLDGVDVATGEHRPALRRIARGATRGAWRCSIPKIILVAVLATVPFLAVAGPWWAAGQLLAYVVVGLPLAYRANLVAARWQLAHALRDPDSLVLVSDDRSAVLTLRRAGSPARPLWSVGWHGAERVGARCGARLRSRVLPEVLGQADRLGITLMVVVPRTLLHVARTELPGSRTGLALPGIRVLLHGGERRMRVKPASPIESAALGEAASIEETERIDEIEEVEEVEEYEVDVILVRYLP